MKKKFFLAAIALTSIAQPSSADPVWEVLWKNMGQWEVRKTESGVTTNYGTAGVDSQDAMEIFVDDGDLKIVHPFHNRVHVFDKNNGTYTIETLTNNWMKVSGSPTSLSDSSGKNIIRKDASGAIRIGENSLVTIEEGGRQKLYALNSAGASIDIDITNGSRLLINGRDIEKSIDNVGALSAALGSVPAISADSPFTCGFGAGTHSYAYAISGGCASKVTERLSLNAALATVVNNHTGDPEDNLTARAGFAFKLGKIDESPKVVARKAAALHDQVVELRKENLQQKHLNKALLARLERLENIANVDNTSAGDIATKN